MSAWPFDRKGGLTDTAMTSDDPAVCAYQMVQLEVLLASLEGKPEESSMVLHRLEIACFGAGRQEDAAAAHERALVMIDRCGYAAKEVWGRSPRIFRRLAAPFRDIIELRYTEARYLAGLKAIDKTLTELQARSPWKDEQ